MPDLHPMHASLYRRARHAAATTAVSATRTAQARVERPECNAPWVGGVMLPQPAGC